MPVVQVPQAEQCVLGKRAGAALGRRKEKREGEAEGGEAIGKKQPRGMNPGGSGRVEPRAEKGPRFFCGYSTVRPTSVAPAMKIMTSRSLRKVSCGMWRTTGMLMSTPMTAKVRETLTASYTALE